MAHQPKIFTYDKNNTMVVYQNALAKRRKIDFYSYPQKKRIRSYGLFSKVIIPKYTIIANFDGSCISKKYIINMFDKLKNIVGRTTCRISAKITQ